MPPRRTTYAKHASLRFCGKGGGVSSVEGSEGLTRHIRFRGDIARLAANRVATEQPFARACYAETAFVPHSAMARWVKEADHVIMIDGCFLKCFGRILTNLIDRQKVRHIDALPLYQKHTDVFHVSLGSADHFADPFTDPLAVELLLTWSGSRRDPSNL